MAFVPENLVRRAHRDPIFDGVSETLVRVDLERSMKALCDAYTAGSHKLIWSPIDRYALHGLLTSYALDQDEERNALADLEFHEAETSSLDYDTHEVLAVLDDHLWETLTCGKRAAFAYHCAAIKQACNASARALSFCIQLVKSINEPDQAISDELGDRLVNNILIRLEDTYGEDEIMTFLNRLPRIESALTTDT